MISARESNPCPLLFSHSTNMCYFFLQILGGGGLLFLLYLQTICLYTRTARHFITCLWQSSPIKDGLVCVRIYSVRMCINYTTSIPKHIQRLQYSLHNTNWMYKLHIRPIMKHHATAKQWMQAYIERLAEDGNASSKLVQLPSGAAARPQ